MKKLFRSAAAVLTSVALLTGGVPAAAAAEAVMTESGVIDLSDNEMCIKDLEGMSFARRAVPQILSSAKGDYRLGDYLDANNKAVYDAFTKLTEPSLEVFSVKLPQPVKFTSKTVDIDDSDVLYDAVFSSCTGGIEAFSFDYPEVFWMDSNKTAVAADSMPYYYDTRQKAFVFTLQRINFQPVMYDSFESMDEVMEYKTKLEEAVADFEVKGETNAEKLKSIHDTICHFTNYDVKSRFSGSALGSLVEPGAVCEGYSKGFKLICDRLGIPCVCIFGNFDESTYVAHMWNYVLMEDGCWYAIDVTWDDRDGKEGLQLWDTFFLKGSKDFFVKHTETTEYLLAKLTYPKLAEWNYGKNPALTTTAVTTTTTTRPTTTTTAKPTTTTTLKPTTTTIKPTTTTKIPTTTTTKPTTTVTKTTTAKPTTTTVSKSTTTVTKPTTTTAKPTSTSAPVTTTITTSSIPATTTAPDPGYLHGDLNRDGKVSIADLVYCVSHVLNISPAANSCDLNDDGRADAFDVVLMRKLVIDVMVDTIRSARNYQ